MRVVKVGCRRRARFRVCTGALVLVFGTIMSGPWPATAATTVVPTSFSGGNAFPFDCGGGHSGIPSMRYQQVYLGSEVGSGTISQLTLSPYFDGSFSATASNVTITLSTTQQAVTGLSTTFADNIGTDVTTVYHGDLPLSSAGGGDSTNHPFDIAIPLQTSFTFNATGGNLLLDVTLPTCPNFNDSHNAPAQVGTAYVGDSGTPEGARVYSLNAAAATGVNDNGATYHSYLAIGTQFTFGSAPPPPNCDRTISSTTGNVTVAASGVTCGSGITVGGNVNVPAGGSLTLTNSHVGGNVNGKGARTVTLCGNTIAGNVTVDNSTGPVLVGDAGDDASSCAGNTVRGNVTLSANTANTELGSNQINGYVIFTNNVGSTASTETSPEVEANTIHLNLNCSGNVSVTNDSHPNNVSGNRNGQCGASGF